MTKVCASCMKPLERKRGESMRDWTARKYCDRLCFFARPLTGDPEARGRKRAQRKFAAERCEFCGSTEKRLSRHHKDGNSQNNDPNNIAILCLGCHSSLHWEENYRPGRKAKACVICGEEFTDYTHSRVKTCSKKCLSELGRRNAAKRKTHGNRYTTGAPQSQDLTDPESDRWATPSPSLSPNGSADASSNTRETA
jgi:hypothetical protein